MPIPDPADIYTSANETVAVTLAPYGRLTTTAEIRAVFGLSDAELPDEMLAQDVYVREVSNALAALDKTLPGRWSDRLAAKPELQTKVGDFALYCIADRICDVLPLVAARTLTDAKATFQRFDTDLQGVIAAIRRRYAIVSKDLSEALEEPAATVFRPTLFGSGKPSYDPVTGS